MGQRACITRSNAGFLPARLLQPFSCSMHAKKSNPSDAVLHPGPHARVSSVDPFAATLPDLRQAHAAPSLAAKTAVVIKSVTARAQGLRGVFLTLAQQHAEAAALLAALESTLEPHARRESWTRLRVALLSHERAECEVVYPTLLRFGLTHQLARAHEHAAGELEELIGTVERLDVRDARFLREVAMLAGYVRGHAEEEENVWFPAAQAILTDGRLEQLDATFLETQGLVRAEL
jgi:hypothetical protein